MESVFDMAKLCQDARTRWLKPEEVHFILLNYEQIGITQRTPVKPPSGSLFIYNKGVNRNFRNDHYEWKKKKNGKAIAEAHERLKIGRVDALNCYYAHGELNPNLNRRSYWILDAAFQDIVLVHYLEVEEKHNSGLNTPTKSSPPCNRINKYILNNTSSPESSKTHSSYQNWSSPVSVNEDNSEFISWNSNLDGEGSSSEFMVEALALRMLENQLSLDDEGGNCGDLHIDNQLCSKNSNELGNFGFPQINYGHQSHSCIGVGSNKDESSCSMLHQGSESQQKQSCSNVLELNPSYNEINIENLAYGNDVVSVTANDKNASSSSYVIWPSSSEKVDLNSVGYGQKDNSLQQSCRSDARLHSKNYQHLGDNLHLHLSETRKFLLETDESVESPPSVTVHQGSKKLLHDKFDCDKRITNSELCTLSKELGAKWMDALDMHSNSKILTADCFGTLYAPNQYISNPSIKMVHKKMFSFREVTPEWAFSYQSSKVIIMGDFLCHPSEYSWSAMFGDTEVPLKIICEGILCCQAPPHAPGRVSLCITSGNRESCSEVREFKYLPKPEPSNPRNSLPQDDAAKRTEELSLLVSFVQTLLSKHSNEEFETEHNTDARTNLSNTPRGKNEEWQYIIQSLGKMSELDIKNWILEELLKDKLQSWLSLKRQSTGITDYTLSKQEMGIIHALSGLGYEWALNSVLSLGVSINFRDARGWTALHWAAHFGREKMVAALLAAGASAGAVTDPTAQDPIGKPPAYVAGKSGHQGLAGYLSEFALNFHVSSLKMENEPFAVGALRAMNNISDKTPQIDTSEAYGDITLRDSLTAVRNSALAAARIQSAFRAHSFRKRQQKIIANFNEHNMTPEEFGELSSSLWYQRGSRGSNEKFQVAALCIQKKFRGWKGRKRFQSLRQQVVKIQAHVRGHQMRKKFRMLWSVSFIDRVILRWHRRGPGLQGLRTGKEPLDEHEEDQILKSFHKMKVDAVLAEAVSSVKSMAESPEARQQYCRMLERYNQAAKEKGEASSSFNATLHDNDEPMNVLQDAETLNCLASINFDEPWDDQASIIGFP